MAGAICDVVDCVGGGGGGGEGRGRALASDVGDAKCEVRRIGAVLHMVNLLTWSMRPARASWSCDVCTCTPIAQYHLTLKLAVAHVVNNMV